MNIDEDDFSDEYDFMDEDDDEAADTRRRTRSQAKTPKKKYMDLLQKIADRYEDEITVDLDDVAKVACSPTPRHLRSLTSLVRSIVRGKWNASTPGCWN
jgi:hypothetical protein